MGGPDRAAGHARPQTPSPPAFPPASPNGVGDVSDASSGGGAGFVFLALVLATVAFSLVPPGAGARIGLLLRPPRSLSLPLELERPG